MKKFISTALIIAISFVGFSQVNGGKYDKLFDEFLMEDFEGCLKQSFKLIDKEESRNEPEPYLYVAMIYLKFADMPEMAETYPNALKESQKYAAKAVKKDQKARNAKDENRAEQDDEGYYWEKNKEFFDQLKRTSMDEADFYFNEDNFSKAASSYSKILKWDSEDENILMITAACYYLSKNTGQGKITLDQAIKLIKDNYSNEDYDGSEVSMPAIEDGVRAYTNYLIDSGDKEGAKAFMNEIYESLSWNESIRSQKRNLE